MNSSFYTEEELKKNNFKSLGKNCLVSRNANFYSPHLIEIGNNVRIDDFCIMSGNIKIKNFVHISAFSALYGKNGIELEDYSGLSPRTTILSASDDFSGDYLIGPMVASHLTNVQGGPVKIKKYCQVGTNCTVFPNVTINEGTVVGAMSLVKDDLGSWSVYAGIPAKYIKKRKKGLLKFVTNQ